MLTIMVYGQPAPQGSKRHVGNGVMIESSKAVKPWREAVVWAAREAETRIAGPVSVEITFTLARPASASKKVKVPFRKPDADKLLRSTLDALVTAGTIEDDARCVDLIAHKRFPGRCADALDVPGAVIRIRSYE